MGKHKEMIPLGRPRNRWEMNIKMKLKVTEWESMDWIHLAQSRTSGGLFEQGNEFGSHKVWGTSGPAEKPSTSQEESAPRS